MKGNVSLEIIIIRVSVFSLTTASTNFCADVTYSSRSVDFVPAAEDETGLSVVHPEERGEKKGQRKFNLTFRQSYSMKNRVRYCTFFYSKIVPAPCWVPHSLCSYFLLLFC